MQNKFLTEFIFESDAIENIKADKKLIARQLKKNKPDGHVGAMLLLERESQNKRTFVTKDLICKVQKLITAEQHTKIGGFQLPTRLIGRYRTINVSIAGKIAPPFYLVPSLMQEWIEKAIKWQKKYLSLKEKENLHAIAHLHFEYERIHPFGDGNGRSGRAIVFYLMRYCELKPFIFTNKDKFDLYYKCFDDTEAMHDYFKIKHDSR